MGRVYVRGHTNIRKRLLVQACDFNLGFLMRKVTGVGTPRSLQGRVGALVAALVAALGGLWHLVAGLRAPFRSDRRIQARIGGSVASHAICRFQTELEVPLGGGNAR